MTHSKKQKVIAIVGPTASGKTALGVSLAKRFNGEIISADSRQVYRGLDIGTEKITTHDMQGIPHYLIGICNPEDTFTVVQFKTVAQKYIRDIIKRKKLPIIVGGTGFYIDALLYDTDFPKVPPDSALRKALDHMSTEKLFEQLKKKDPVRSETIDPHNKQRLIRALEIIEHIGSVPPSKQKKNMYDAFIIGIQTEDDILKQRISERLTRAFEKGLIEEIMALVAQGVSWNRINEFGLEYRIAGKFIRDEITKETMHAEMQTELWHYVKRQRTWFKRNKEIRWFSPDDIHKIIEAVGMFLKK